jgi:hypothetical protein
LRIKSASFEAVAKVRFAERSPPPLSPAPAVSVVPVTAHVAHPISPVVELSVTGEVAVTPNVPEAFGKVSVGVPAVACGVSVTVPLVAPVIFNWPVVLVATPMVRAGDTQVRFGDAAKAALPL